MQPGLRLLVVEDEPILLMELEDLLTDLGCEVAGSAGQLGTAVDLARNLDFDLALCDVSLGAERIDPVAEAVRARGLPVIFLTGHGEDFEVMRGAPCLAKPYGAGALAAAIQRVMEAADVQ
jgi:DNA-binding response OmpR family regulator